MLYSTVVNTDALDPIHPGPQSFHSDPDSASAWALRCKACGTLLVDGKDENHAPDSDAISQTPPEPKPKVERPPKRRVEPHMMRNKEPRLACRVGMLSAIPGVGAVRAAAIVRRYPTFSQLRKADEADLANLIVKNECPLGPALAEAVLLVVR